MSKLGKVLLADDSPHAQRMGERILREEGYDVVTVTDGETAILRVKDVNPDVVIVDAFLPQVSGYDLCGFIKKQSQHSHVRVLLTSTALERVDEDHMYRVGADGQLKKPFEASVMLKSLKDLISGSEKDSKKKRGASTFNLNDYEDGSSGAKASEVTEGERTTDKAGVSPLKAWLEQRDDEDVAQADPLPEPVAVGATASAAAAEPVSLSNPQLLRRMEDEEEDLSLRNNPVAKLRNAPISPGEGSSRLQSISGRTQDADTDSGPTTRSFRLKSKSAEVDEPLVREVLEEPTPASAKPRRSLLDALAEYENEAAVLDEVPDPLTIPEPTPADEIETELVVDEPLAETVSLLGEDVAVEAFVVEDALAPEPEAPAAPEPEPVEEPLVAASAAAPLHEDILTHAAAAVTAQGEVRRLALGASGVRLDHEEIRAAVEIAVSASMAAIVDEVTRYVTLTLEARYRHANEAPADKASD